MSTTQSAWASLASFCSRGPFPTCNEGVEFPLDWSTWSWLPSPPRRHTSDRRSCWSRGAPLVALSATDVDVSWLWMARVTSEESTLVLTFWSHLALLDDGPEKRPYHLGPESHHCTHIVSFTYPAQGYNIWIKFRIKSPYKIGTSSLYESQSKAINRLLQVKCWVWGCQLPIEPKPALLMPPRFWSHDHDPLVCSTHFLLPPICASVSGAGW